MDHFTSDYRNSNLYSGTTSKNDVGVFNAATFSGNSKVGNNLSNVSKEVSLLDLKPGDTFEGEISTVNGEEVNLVLTNGEMLQARIEGNILLNVGQILQFQIQSNEQNKIVLKPFLQNQTLVTDNLLRQAMLPVNDKTRALVTSLMENGMSVNKQNLSLVYRASLNFPEAKLSSIAMLSKMNIPVTKDNITQYENYKNFEYKLLDSMDDILSDIDSIMDNLSDSKKESFLQDIFNAFEQGDRSVEKLDSIKSGENLGVTEGLTNENTRTDAIRIETTSINMPGDETGTSEVLPATNSSNETLTKNILLNETADNEALSRGIVNKETIADGTMANTALDNGNLEKETLPKDVFNSGTLTKEAISNETSLDTNRTSEVLLNETVTNKTGVNEILTGGNSALEQISGKNENTGAALNETEKVVIENEKMTNLRASSKPEVKEKLREIIQKNWMLEPKDVESKEKIQKLYSRVERETEKLQEILEKNNENPDFTPKSAANIQKNLQFMEQLENVFSYVQLPLKFSEGKAHGDLYVMTNKKNLAKRDGMLTAFLHLDMTNLGSTDIKLTLDTNQNRLRCDFYLQEDSIELVSKNIDKLNNALKEKGYEVKTTIGPYEDDKPVIEKMEENAGLKMTGLSYQTFDIRA